MRPWKSVAAGALAALALTGCEPTPVEWGGEPRPPSMAARMGAATAIDSAGALPAAPARESAPPASTRLVVLADGSVALESIPAVATSPAASDTAACAGSLRTDGVSRSEVYGAWWSRRDGGRAWLVAARSDDGGRTWTPPVPVDTTDRSVAACDRPAPGIAADATSGYVHVTYFLHGPGGPGVFFSHSMERGALFHAPVPIMYGDRPAATAVAAADSVVVVAFENPNGPRPRIAIAVSRSWGHIFERERPEASSGEVAAEAPLVAVRDSVVAVGWYGGEGHVLARVGALK